MDVLIVAPQPVFTPRGTPLSVYHRANVASGLGMRSVLLTYEEGADPDIAGLEIVRIPRLPFLRPVVIGPSWGKLVRDLIMVLWTVGLLIRYRPPVVHAHEEAAFWCRLLRGPFRFRLVYDMHSSLPRQLRAFEFTESALLIGLFGLLEGWTLRGSDAVLTISPALARYARSRMSDPSRHTLVENSLLDPVVLRGTGGAEEGRIAHDLLDRIGGPVVFYAGSFEPYQGIDLLIRGFRHVRPEIPEARLVLAGGTQGQVRRFRSLAEEEGVATACRFLGTVSQETVRTILSASAVVTSPRVTGNNTPLKLYELLASGKPLVATRVGSHTQVLDETVCFLAEPEPGAMGRAMVESLRNRVEAEARAAAARRLYHERYSREAYVAKMSRVLNLVGLDPGRYAGTTGRGPGSTEKSSGVPLRSEVTRNSAVAS